LTQNIVFENDVVLAFLDIRPLHKGHTLIIPKAHYAGLHQLPSEVRIESI
jgi:histidine triad (HIT) family protein